MRKSIVFSLGICLFVALVSPLAAWAAPEKHEDPVVRAVMFWMEGCPHCHTVIDVVLPPLQAQYGDRFQIELIELRSIEDFDRLVVVAEHYGLSKDRAAVPFLVIGDRVLIGSGQIPAELPGLIETHLAAGGVDYPAVPGFEDALPDHGEGEQEGPEAAAASGLVEASSAANTAELQTPAQEPKSNGFTLAALVMAGMVAALIYAGVVFVFGAGRLAGSGWAEFTLPVLAVIGIGVAAYLSYVETQSVEAVCGPIGDCNTVQSSPYAYLFGVIPLGIVGVAGFFGILTAWFVRRRAQDRVGDYATLALFGMALFGTLFCIYLTFLELFVIRAVCMWCLASAVIMTLILVLSVGPAADWINRGTS